MHKDIQPVIQNRLRRIEGQVRGLQKLVGEDAYCVDVITQTSAVRKALSAVENLILENHLSEHVVHQMKSGKEKKAIEEVLRVYKLSHNK